MQDDLCANTFFIRGRMIIYFAFAKNKKKYSVLSQIISWAEKISYSHTAIIIHLGDDIHVYESVWPISRKISYSEWVNTYEVKKSYSFGVDCKDLEREMITWLDSHVNKPYSVMQILMIGLAMISAPFAKVISKSKLNGSAFLICTELVGDFMTKFFNADFKMSTQFLKLSQVEEFIKKSKGL